jgi:hypothetical protein
VVNPHGGDRRTVEVGLSFLKSNACEGGRHPAMFTGLIASFATQAFHAPDRSIPGVSIFPPPFLVSLGFILRQGSHSWPSLSAPPPPSDAKILASDKSCRYKTRVEGKRSQGPSPGPLHPWAVGPESKCGSLTKSG